MRDTNPPVKAKPASSWIERIALPLLVSVMEAQPLALGIALLTLAVAGTLAAMPVSVGDITLTALGLLWWAMFVEHISNGSVRRRQLAWLHLLGWLIAFLAIAGPRLPSMIIGQDIPAVLLDVVLITWLWRRSMSRAQIGFTYGQLATSFKIGFGVLLAILLIVIIAALPETNALYHTLTNALPIFFLTGLIALSLARLGMLRHARRSTDGSQADPTRSWLLALTLFGAGIIVMVTALELIFSFSAFEAIVTVLMPLWNGMAIVVGWMLYGIIFILSPAFYFFSFLVGLLTGHQGTSQTSQKIGVKPTPFHNPATLSTLSPEVITIGRWVVLGLLVIGIFAVVGTNLRRWYMKSNNEEVEEVREQLDTRSLVGQRWREWWRQHRHARPVTPPLELLDSASVRPLYRALLLSVADNDALRRNPTETPTEYQSRLLVYLISATPAIQDQRSDSPLASDTIILEELTSAYIMERYGSELVSERKRSRLQTWVPRLIARLCA
ncbi:MAG TPA: DUF4129 domain-containing protein [Ktedonobacteraceae bacterium]|nr:DUF4129 domain-containing protein [Ktedonobacteraceae bacterium]